MKTEAYISNSILIKAPIHLVWDCLTLAEHTKKYMFGCEAHSDWKLGSSLLWKGISEGKEVIYVKGNIELINPPFQLIYTAFDPFSKIEDIRKNHLSVEYLLTDQQGETQLTVKQGDYSQVADAEKRYQEAYNNGEGWNPILIQIKSLAESLNI